MTLFAKVGDQVILKENIDKILSLQNGQNTIFNPQATVVNANLNSDTKFDFTTCIKLRYHNPGSVDLASNASNMRDDFLRQIREVKAPDLSSLPKILESCDSMKMDYASLLSLPTQTIPDFLAKNKQFEAEINKKSVNQSNYNPYKPEPQPMPTFSRGYSESDVQKFVSKFKCAKEMAIGYLEAFQNYADAEREFITNTGWKG